MSCQLYTLRQVGYGYLCHHETDNSHQQDLDDQRHTNNQSISTTCCTNGPSQSGDPTKMVCHGCGTNHIFTTVLDIQCKALDSPVVAHLLAALMGSFQQIHDKLMYIPHDARYLTNNDTICGIILEQNQWPSTLTMTPVVGPTNDALQLVVNVSTPSDSTVVYTLETALKTWEQQYATTGTLQSLVQRRLVAVGA